MSRKVVRNFCILQILNSELLKSFKNMKALKAIKLTAVEVAEGTNELGHSQGASREKRENSDSFTGETRPHDYDTPKVKCFNCNK